MSKDLISLLPGSLRTWEGSNLDIPDFSPVTSTHLLHWSLTANTSDKARLLSLILLDAKHLALLIAI
jgi:hypothetical protein